MTVSPLATRHDRATRWVSVSCVRWMMSPRISSRSPAARCGVTGELLQIDLGDAHRAAVLVDRDGPPGERPEEARSAAHDEVVDLRRGLGEGVERHDAQVRTLELRLDDRQVEVEVVEVVLQDVVALVVLVPREVHAVGARADREVVRRRRHVHVGLDRRLLAHLAAARPRCAPRTWRSPRSSACARCSSRSRPSAVTRSPRAAPRARRPRGSRAPATKPRVSRSCQISDMSRLRFRRVNERRQRTVRRTTEPARSGGSSRSSGRLGSLRTWRRAS